MPAEADAGFPTEALPLPPRYAFAIERMSMRPEPSPPDEPVACPAGAELLLLDDDDDDEEERGVSLASCARLFSENSTEFSLRSPRSFVSAA